VLISVVSVLLRQPNGFQGLGPIHVSLEAHNASVMHFEDGRRVVHELDSAAPPKDAPALGRYSQ